MEIPGPCEHDMTLLTAYLRRWWPAAVTSFGIDEQVLYVENTPPGSDALVAGRISQYQATLVAWPLKYEKERNRAPALDTVLGEITRCPACRAIWRGESLAGFTGAEKDAALVLCVRALLMAAGFPAPNWTSEARED